MAACSYTLRDPKSAGAPPFAAVGATAAYVRPGFKSKSALGMFLPVRSGGTCGVGGAELGPCSGVLESSSGAPFFGSRRPRSSRWRSGDCEEGPAERFPLDQSHLLAQNQFDQRDPQHDPCRESSPGVRFLRYSVTTDSEASEASAVGSSGSRIAVPPSRGPFRTGRGVTACTGRTNRRSGASIACVLGIARTPRPRPSPPGGQEVGGSNLPGPTMYVAAAAALCECARRPPSGRSIRSGIHDR